MADKNGTQQPKGITGITVSGFKSLRDESHIEVRPLTILAGANSSGKSSIMQPLLLMKQTLDLDYDPGTFKFDGPNAYFTEPSQFLARLDSQSHVKRFSVTIERDNFSKLTNNYELTSVEDKIQVVETSYLNQLNSSEIRLRFDMSSENLLNQFPPEIESLRTAIENITEDKLASWNVIRNRCFLYPGIVYSNGEVAALLDSIPLRFFPVNGFANTIRSLIHVPGLRGRPERNYPSTSPTGNDFEGTFEKYIAGVVHQWHRIEDKRVFSIAKQLHDLGLAGGIGSNRIDDATVEITVGRTLNSSKDDTVNIADVGFGVSQVLPVLVALLVTEPGQLVYIEQPELHLHPRAQVALAQVLADAANRGVRVVVETHSALLIQGIQTLVAEEKLLPDKVILHWFKRNDEGVTQIIPQELDPYGAYGDWPEDFADVQFETDSAYLNAVEKRRFEEIHDGQKPEMSGD